MALASSTSLEVDQTDEDFFDRLINDDDDDTHDVAIDHTGSLPTLVDRVDSSELKAFASLSLDDEVKLGPDFGLDSGSRLGARTDAVLASENESLCVFSDGGNVIESKGNVSADDAEGLGRDLALHSNSRLVVERDTVLATEIENLGVFSDRGNAIESKSNVSVDDGDELGPRFGLDSNSRLGAKAGTVLTTEGGNLGVYSDRENVTESKGNASVDDGEQSGPDFGLECNSAIVGRNDMGTEKNLEVFSEIENVNMSTDVIERKSIIGSGNGVKVVQWSSFGGSEIGSGLYSEVGDVLEDPFANVGGVYSVGNEYSSVSGFSGDLNHGGQGYGVVFQESVGGQDLNGGQYWENMYPGWRFDPLTGQWLPDEAATAEMSSNVNAAESFDVSRNTNNIGISSSQVSDGYPLQSTSQSSTSEYLSSSVFNWNQSLPENVDYPAHMVFDPQYPGWYYDTIAQEWKSLESYIPAENQSTTVDYSQTYSTEDYSSQGFSNQLHSDNLNGQYNQETADMWATLSLGMNNVADVVFTERQKLGEEHSADNGVNSFTDQWAGPEASESVHSFKMPSTRFDLHDGVPQFPNIDSSTEFYHHHSQLAMEPSQKLSFSTTYSGNQKSSNFDGQHFGNVFQFSHAPNGGRSSAGRPPHPLVTFGFGGKLLVTKDVSSFMPNSFYEREDTEKGVLKVHNLAEIVLENGDSSPIGFGAHDYFNSLLRQSFSGPLVGGSVGAKEVNKWLDDQIARCGAPYINNKDGEVYWLLFSLLKISCQQYGKLRSPFVPNQQLQESDCPESAVAKLFASAKSNSAQSSVYWPTSQCLQSFPSEQQIQATALDMQRLLVSGRKKEALECAQHGQLWGPALVLATQLGDQAFRDTVMKMAVKQLAAGCPLRTLCLLIAGNGAQVFSNASTPNSLPGSVNVYHQTAQIGANDMLDGWEDNLAMITANRTKGDEPVITHLGDCLWRERGEVIAAHLCYLVAEANFESYSGSARLCLIGADHLKFPRTYASPEAIQRTELFEYSKVLGNSQFLLLPFQPYKLVYAYMLAEVGKISVALKFCQSLLKSLKTGQAPQVEMWRQQVSLFEERLRGHQQSGYGIPDTSKLVGKLLTFIDKTAHRVVGDIPPPVPVTSYSSIQHDEYAQNQGNASGYDRQPTMFMPSIPSSAPLTSHSTVQHNAYTPSTIQHNEYTPIQAHASGYGSQPAMFMPSLPPSVASTSNSRELNEYTPRQRGAGGYGSQPRMLMPSLPSSVALTSTNRIQHNEHTPKQGDASGYGSRSMFLPSLPPSVPLTSNSSIQDNEYNRKQEAASGNGSQSAIFMPLLPSAAPLTSNSSIQDNEYNPKQEADGGYGRQSTTTFTPSLIPSASMEPISNRSGENNQLEMPNRSISEPDFGTEPQKAHPSKDPSSDNQAKPSASSSSSRFGRFGSQIFQKTVGLVFRSRPDRQAKLGDKNKFYYDEKLKRWVEEGTEPPAEESVLPPPPTAASFPHEIPKPSEQEVKSPVPPEQSPGIPQIPPSSNQFSARGRIAVRSRYVDTFNKGSASKTGGVAFHSPLPASTKTGGVVNPKFFVPSAMAPSEEKDSNVPENKEDAAVTSENLSTSGTELFSSPPESSKPTSFPPFTHTTLQRFPNPKIFVPSAMAPSEEKDSDIKDNKEEAAVTSKNPSTSGTELLSSPRESSKRTSLQPFPHTTMRRFPSMDNIVQQRRESLGNTSNDSRSPDQPSRRVASWNGSLSEPFHPTLEATALHEPVRHSLLSRPPTDLEP